MLPDGEGRVGRSGDRAVSNTIGFVLVFSFLIIAFTIYQGILVPDQNRTMEFDHNQEVQSRMQDLRNAIVNAAGGREGSVSIRLGADYPRRWLARNLAASSGTVETTTWGPGIVIENVTAVDRETADYVGNGSGRFGPFATRSLVYEPHYTRYRTAPRTVVEHTVAYNRFDNGENLTLTGQAVIDGRRITLIALNGSLSETRADTLAVDAEALSTPSGSVAITNTSGGRVDVTIPTKLAAGTWAELLADQMDAPGPDDGYVVSVEDAGPNAVSVVLEAGVTYDLRVAEVGVGTRTDDPVAHYATDVSGDDTSVAEGGSRKLVVEVRDRFNNPVSNVTVEANLTESAGSGNVVTPATDETGSDGRASFTYEAPGNVDGTRRAEVTVFFDSEASARKNVTFDVAVLDADGSGSCGAAGTGGSAPWCPDTDTTVSQPGGVISDIGAAEHINVSDPRFTSVNPKQGDVQENEEWFKLAFAVEEDRADLTGTTRYLFVVPEKETGFEQKLDDSSVTLENRTVVVYEDASVNDDGSGYTKLVEANLKQGDLRDWYGGDETIDLLDSSHYSGNVQSELDEIADFMRNNDVRIHVVDMDGRVTFDVG